MSRTNLCCFAWIAPTVLAFAATASFAASPTSQWPSFRGPNGNGYSADVHPTRWSSTQNVAWSAEIDGGGWSSPVVVGDRIFVTTAISSEFKRPKGWGGGVASMGSFYASRPPQKPISFQVQCLRLSDGKSLWKSEVIAKKPSFKIHPSNSYATETPAADGKHVYAYFAAVGVVACLDHDGNEIWKRELGAYPTANNFGSGSSLAILDGRVFVQCDNERKSFMCALDSKTGKDIWRVDRAGRTSWSSPVVWRNRQRTELVVCGSDGVVAYEPGTGDVLWKLTGPRGAFSASPTFDVDRLYLGKSSRNSRGPLMAVNAGAEGEFTADASSKAIAWVVPTAAPSMASPVVVGGRVFVLSRGILSCHEAKTGKRLYRERLRNASSVTSSLWAAGNALYVLNESGDTMVVEVGDEMKLVATNKVPGLYWSTPSVAGNALLLRGAAKLHCIRQSAAADVGAE